MGKAINALHVGCGSEPLPDWLAGCHETRLDIDPRHSPDVLASMLDLGEIGGFDVVYSAHSLEHLYPDEVGVALGEFLRVLNVGGFAAIIVPDLEGVVPTDDVVYEAPCGPVTGRDMYYGHAEYVARSRHMAHHTGFVEATLMAALSAAGFSEVKVWRDRSSFNLVAIAAK